MSASLHPQNDRRGAGFYWPPGVPPRRPYAYVAIDGDVRHGTPLCPELEGRPYRAWGAEEALYAFGENHCRTCRHYTTDGIDDTWTDPRYRRDAR